MVAQGDVLQAICIFGFQSKIRGWISYPNLTLGYNFEKFAISMKGELIILTHLTEKQDDVEISSDRNSFAGTAVGIYIEQPLWKDNYIVFGLRVNYTKFYYPTWAAFARSRGMPSSTDMRFAVPPGSMAKGTSVPMRPWATSMTLPSPP